MKASYSQRKTNVTSAHSKDWRRRRLLILQGATQPLALLLTAVFFLSVCPVQGPTPPEIGKPPTDGQELITRAEAFLVKNANSVRLRKVLEEMNAVNPTWNQSTSAYSEVGRHKNGSQGSSLMKILVTNTTAFLHILPNLIGDSLVKLRGNNDTSSSVGVDRNASSGAVPLVDAVQGLVQLLSTSVTCQLCRGQERRRRVRRNVETGSFQEPFSRGSASPEISRTLQKAADPNANRSDMGQGVEREERHEAGASSGLTSGSGIGSAMIVDSRDLVGFVVRNRSKGTSEGDGLSPSGSGIISSGVSSSGDGSSMPVKLGEEKRISLRLCVEACLSELTCNYAGFHPAVHHVLSFGESLNNVLNSLLEVLTKARLPIGMDPPHGSKSLWQPADFRHEAQELLSGLVNLTRQLGDLVGNLSQGEPFSDCQWSFETPSIDQGGNASLLQIVNKCKSLVTLLSNGVSDALSFAHFAFYLSDIAHQARKRHALVYTTSGEGSAFVQANAKLPAISAESYDDSLILSYCSSIVQPMPSIIITTSDSNNSAKSTVNACQQFDSVGEEIVGQTLCACEQLRSLEQTSMILNNTNFISPQEAKVFGRLFNVTCERSATMKSLLHSCPTSWKVANVCKSPLFNLQCPSLSYAATDISAHWNAEVRDGYHAVLTQILEGVKIRGSLTKKKDSPLFRCGVKCGVGMMGLSENYETPLLVFSSAIEALWFVLFVCTVYWICSKKRYRLSKFRTCYLFLQIPYAVSTLLKTVMNFIYVKNPSWCFQDNVLFKGVPTSPPKILCMIVGRLVHAESFLWVIGFLILNLYWYWIVKSITNGGASLHSPQTSFWNEVKKKMEKDATYVVEFGVCMTSIVASAVCLGRTLADKIYTGHPLMRTCIRAQGNRSLTAFIGPMILMAPTFAFLLLSAMKTHTILRALKRMNVRGKVGKYRKLLEAIYRRQAILGAFLFVFLFITASLFAVLVSFAKRPQLKVQENFEDYLRCHLLVARPLKECDELLWTRRFWIVMRILWVFRQANEIAMALLLSFAWKDTL